MGEGDAEGVFACEAVGAGGGVRYATGLYMGVDGERHFGFDVVRLGEKEEKGEEGREYVRGLGGGSGMGRRVVILDEGVWREE